jgi:hypothetical protein
MLSSTKQVTTCAAVKNVAPIQSLYSSRPLNSFLVNKSALRWEGNSDSSSFSDTYSDTGADTDIESDTSEYASLVSEGKSDAGLDSEAEEILKDIAQLRADGPAKPTHTPYTVKLWKREGEFWER